MQGATAPRALELVDIRLSGEAMARGTRGVAAPGASDRFCYPAGTEERGPRAWRPGDPTEPPASDRGCSPAGARYGVELKWPGRPGDPIESRSPAARVPTAPGGVP